MVGRMKEEGEQGEGRCVRQAVGTDSPVSNWHVPRRSVYVCSSSRARQHQPNNMFFSVYMHQHMSRELTGVHVNTASMGRHCVLTGRKQRHPHSLPWANENGILLSCISISCSLANHTLEAIRTGCSLCVPCTIRLTFVVARDVSPELMLVRDGDAAWGLRCRCESLLFVTGGEG